MKTIYLLLLLIAAVSAFECDTTSVPVILTVTGDIFGNYAPTSTVNVDILFNNNGWGSILEGGTYSVYCKDPESGTSCPVVSVNAVDIPSNTYTRNLCIRKRLYTNTHNYQLRLYNSMTGSTGYCVHLKPADESFASYISLCMTHPSAEVIGYFSLMQTQPAPFSVFRRPWSAAPIAEPLPIIYVDHYTNFNVRPYLQLTFETQANNVNVDSIDYALYTLDYSEPTAYGFTFDFNTLTFDSSVQYTLTTPQTITIYNRKGEETTQLSYNIQSVMCDEPNQYPVVFTRVYYYASTYECFTLTSNNDPSNINTDCPGTGSEWFVDISAFGNGHFIQEHYMCTSSGKYTLVLTNYNTAVIPSLISTPWSQGSYLTLTALSQKFDGQEDFAGYIIGDFAYTHIFNESGEGETNNSVTITVGPVICAANEHVLLLQKFSTTSTGAEGFVLYQTINNEYSVLSKSFGGAYFIPLRFDPIYRVFLCVKPNSYKLSLLYRSYVLPVSGETASCSGWSTDNSAEARTYVNLAGNTVTQKHPTFMSIQLLDANVYYGGEIEIPIHKIEGENYAVFDTDKVHVASPYIPEVSEPGYVSDIYSTTDCHLNIYFSTNQALFTIYDEEVVYTQGTTLTKYIDTNANIKIQCTDTDPSCAAISTYSFTCYQDANEAAARTTNTVDCSDYFTLPDPANPLLITSTYKTPSGLAETIYVQVTSVIKDSEVAKFIPSYQIMTLNIVPYENNACTNYSTVQGGDIVISVKNPNPTGTCTVGDKVVPDTLYTMTTNDDGFINIHFEASSITPIVCSINGIEYTVAVKPRCESNVEPIHTSIPLTSTTYAEPCVDGKSIEKYCVYNPFSMKAEYVQYISVCHKSVFENDDAAPPKGHGYVFASFSIATVENAEDTNAAPSATWFKQELTYIMEELAIVPLRNIYINDIVFDDVSKTNSLSVIVDTAFEYTRDFAKLFNADHPDSVSYIAKINQYLDINYPAYWATHDLVIESSDFKLTPDICNAVTDENIDFEYIDQTSHETKDASVQNAEFTSSIMWYYSYYSVSNTADYTFNGAITRYCRPKYYEALFMNPSVNTLSQQIDYPWSYLNMKVILVNQDPRSVNVDVRYALARSLYRFVLNTEGSTFSPVELYDVNAYMIQGDDAVDAEATENDDSYLVFRNTYVYFEIRARSATNVEDIKNHIQTDLLYNTDYLLEEIQDEIFEFMSTTLGGSFRRSSKKIRIEF